MFNDNLKIIEILKLNEKNLKLINYHCRGDIFLLF